VLGFEEGDDDQGQPLERTCHLFDSESGGGFELVLTQGLPPGDYLVGLDHFAFEAASSELVDRLYRRAIKRAFQATRPRLLNGRWKCFLFDPDGYKIEISSTVSPA